MPAFRSEAESTGGRRQLGVAVAMLVLALAASYLPPTAQEQVAGAIRASVLRPFLATQRRLVAARLRAADVEVLRSHLDSLAAMLSTDQALVDENRTLRSLLGLSKRVGPSFRPADVIRPGTPGSESMFILDIGSADGVREGAPVVDRHGLVGVIRDVRTHSAVGMDWTHPDFRVSAMIPDGSAYGIVENRRSTFRGGDRLLLDGVAYHESIRAGTPVLTSGLGGIFPRGIPIGRIDRVAGTQAHWRKSYWLTPMVQPASVTQVLVAVGKSTPQDVSRAWPLDSLQTREQVIDRERAQVDSLRAMKDSVRLLQGLLEQARSSGEGGS